jgi:hypothetical protein
LRWNTTSTISQRVTSSPSDPFQEPDQHRHTLPLARLFNKPQREVETKGDTAKDHRGTLVANPDTMPTL